MKLYHGQTSAVSTLVITVLTIIVITGLSDRDIANLYRPLFSMVILLCTVVFIINIPKLSACNLSASNKNINLKWNTTLFDFIVPYIVAINSVKRKSKSKGIFFIVNLFFGFSSIILTAFMCVKGDLLYSISPLQMLFQISSIPLIRNFDALFNYLVYFAYFGAITVLLYVYKIIKIDFKYWGYWDLLLLIPFFVLQSVISNTVFKIMELVAIVAILLGRNRKAYYEKTSH